MFYYYQDIQTLTRVGRWRRHETCDGMTMNAHCGWACWQLLWCVTRQIPAWPSKTALYIILWHSKWHGAGGGMAMASIAWTTILLLLHVPTNTKTWRDLLQTTVDRGLLLCKPQALLTPSRTSLVERLLHLNEGLTPCLPTCDDTDPKRWLVDNLIH